MTAIINGNIVLPDRVVQGQALLYNHRIEGLVPPEQIPADATVIDAEGGYVLPGLIDLHIHGFAGVDASDADQAGLVQMGNALLKEGVTGFLATTMTIDAESLKKAWKIGREAKGKCPNLLGVNAEGPLISPAKCGAQDPAFAIPPDPALMTPYADVIRLTTIAPEQPGAIETVKALTQVGISVAVGHTAAHHDAAMACIDAGASHATHLFNAMNPLHHRDPGAVGAVLNSAVTCELIVDNHHVHPALYEPIWRIKGRKLCFVTDCLAAGGLPPGEYTLGGAPVVADGILCRRPDGTIAGSVLTLLQGVQNVCEHTAIPLWECVNCASLNPAGVLGLANRKGSLEPGKDADVVITDRHFTVTATILGGETIYQAGNMQGF